MDFRLTEEQQALQQAARRYARERLPALAQQIEQSCEPPSHALILEYAQQGFLGINVPEKYGGLGRSSLDALIVLEEFGKISSAIAFPVFESCVGPVRARSSGLPANRCGNAWYRVSARANWWSRCRCPNPRPAPRSPT